MRFQFVSEIDRLLQQFDKEHPKLSLSQEKEQEKYARIYKLRDGILKAKQSLTINIEKFLNKQ